MLPLCTPLLRSIKSDKMTFIALLYFPLPSFALFCISFFFDARAFLAPTMVGPSVSQSVSLTLSDFYSLGVSGVGGVEQEGFFRCASISCFQVVSE